MLQNFAIEADVSAMNEAIMAIFILRDSDTCLQSNRMYFSLKNSSLYSSEIDGKIGSTVCGSIAFKAHTATTAELNNVTIFTKSFLSRYAAASSTIIQRNNALVGYIRLNDIISEEYSIKNITISIENLYIIYQ